MTTADRIRELMDKPEFRLMAGQIAELKELADIGRLAVEKNKALFGIESEEGTQKWLAWVVKEANAIDAYLESTTKQGDKP